MYVSSARFAASLTTSHDVSTVVRVLDSSYSEVMTLDVVSGNVSIDSTQATRRSCSLTMQDPTGTLVPDAASDILQPYSGYLLRIERGISWRDGTSETFPLGTLWPYNPRVDDSGEQLQIQVDGYDTSKVISRTRWTQPFSIAAGTNTVSAIQSVLDNRMPGLRYNVTPTGNTVPATVLGADLNQNDPWNDVSSLASADGLEVFFDPMNIVVIRPIPNPDTAAITAVYDDGVNGTMTQLHRQNNGDVIYTGVIVTSEGSGVATPIRSVQWRSDTSLRIPYFYTTSLITTQAQADAVAAALMTQVTRAEYGVEVTAVPDPRQQVGDVVRITRSKSKIDDVFAIVQMTMPLDPESLMTFQTSQRRTH